MKSLTPFESYVAERENNRGAIFSPLSPRDISHTAFLMLHISEKISVILSEAVSRRTKTMDDTVLAHFRRNESCNLDVNRFIRKNSPPSYAMEQWNVIRSNDTKLHVLLQIICFESRAKVRFSISDCLPKAPLPRGKYQSKRKRYLTGSHVNSRVIYVLIVPIFGLYLQHGGYVLT